MIEHIGELANNPVRAHIRMGFRRVKEESQQLTAVLDDLQEQQFNAAHSRVLIFVRSRRRAEEAAELLAELAKAQGLAWAGQIDSFHAGLDSHDRSRKYNAYKAEQAPGEPAEDGRTVVLVATKAFGMGMDINNIHYVYHLGPSSTFEDFLQEIGRAGRNEQARRQAGFTAERPIRTLCIMSSGEFRALRDLQHKSALSWGHVQLAQQQVHQYWSRFRSLQPSPHEALALPLDLGQTRDDEAGVRFRLALHWLEELGRIRLGLYTPAFLPILLLPAPKYSLLPDESQREQVCQLVEGLRASRYNDGAAVSMPMEELKAAAGVRNHTTLFRLLFQAQKAQALSIDRYLTIETTKLRDAELRAWQPRQTGPTSTLPLVEALFALAQQMLAPVRPLSQRHLTGEELDHLIIETSWEHFAPRKLYWHEEKKGQIIEGTHLAQQLAKEWRERRAKFALKLVRLLPKVRLQSMLHPGGMRAGSVTQLIYNGNSSPAHWQTPLARLREKLLALLAHVVKANKTSFNFADLLLKLGLEEESVDYLQQLLFLARSLGYVKTNGSFLPMGIELFLDSIAEPDHENPESADLAVYQQFVEGNQLKELRLLALECLTELEGEAQDSFIKRYFACDGSADLVGLLGEHLGADHEKLQAFRQEALLEAEQKLNQEQRRVYDAPLAENLQVIAGPGSGKTHTLTLRVARLIQKEKVPPNQILILAYNRAVVVELQDRLGTLFQKLGYGRLIKQLHVYTFHGLCKRCLGKELDGVEFDGWVPALAQALARNPQLIQQQLGSITYAFVDEFQDITAERLQMLVAIAPPATVKLCVIGDPNQSIYGYERVKEGGALDPFPYYEQFRELYKPQQLYLRNNYRSYPAILEAAAGLLAGNPTQFAIPAMEAMRQPGSTMPYCEVLAYRETKTDWKAKLRALLTEEYAPGMVYQQVAVMMRSNDEVFRAYNELREADLPPGVSLRIQGASASPVASREFYHLLSSFRAAPTAPLSPDYLKEFVALKQKVMRRFQGVWDNYLIELVHCLLLEFRVEAEEDATNQDLLEFVEDMARKDDGHFTKLYDKHQATVAPDHTRREVVLTTMHKVKGLEFDAVLLPPGFSDFEVAKPPKPGESNPSAAEWAEDERRLFYVAYTRARYRLAVINYDREAAVMAGQAYSLANKEQKLGRIIKPGLDKLFISWGGRETNQRAHEFIRDSVQVGTPISLRKNTAGKWQALYQGTIVGQLQGQVFGREPHLEQIEGLTVAGIFCYTLEESKVYDARHNKNFTDTHWHQSAMARGYVYVVDFAGYYKET
jgi:ATP-dependent DNA helicase RecQ